MNEAAQIIARLGLEPLRPEGGHFARLWTSTATTPTGRPTATVAYYLISPGEFSSLHRLDVDEIWHFHAGDPVEHLQLLRERPGRLTTLGSDVLAGQVPHLLVPRGVWQGAGPGKPRGTARGWSLLSCTMTPGWSDGCYEHGDRDTLCREFPDWAPLIQALTRV